MATEQLYLPKGYLERRIGPSNPVDDPLSLRHNGIHVMESLAGYEDEPIIAHVDYIEGEGDDPGLLTVSPFDGSPPQSAPVFEARNPAHHEAIGEIAASGIPVGFEAGGVFGVLIKLGHPQGDYDLDKYQQFWTIKDGRPATAKVPILVTPERQGQLIDFPLLHDAIQDYQYTEFREQFWGEKIIHTVVPVRQDIDSLQEAAVITSSFDLIGRKEDQYLPVPTICMYWQYGDPDWKAIADAAYRHDPHATYGVTSDNPHGKPPAYNFSELIARLARTGKLHIGAIVRDQAAELSDMRSSHTQVRLPLKNEEPELVIIRIGAVSPEAVAAQTRMPVRVLESIKNQPASRGYRAEDNLDKYVDKYNREKNRIIAERNQGLLYHGNRNGRKAA